MPTYAMLTRLSTEAINQPGDLSELGDKVSRALREQVPEAKWLNSYAVLGPADYLDIFEAPDEKVASKASLVIRSLGHATTETWILTPWEQFKGLAQ